MHTPHPVILAGGAGTRLWPLSSAGRPKPFQRLLGDKTMLQETLARLSQCGCGPPTIVCHASHRLPVVEQCREVGVEPAAVVLEPASRNTAPAIALAALHASRDGVDRLLLVLPADHRIGNVAAFRRALRQGRDAAEGSGEDARIVVFGVPPSRAETGYGYIRAVPAPGEDRAVRKVAAFHEKPGRADAERYQREAGHYWNSGMFLMRGSVFLQELTTHRPDIADACRAAVAGARQKAGFLLPDATAWEHCPAASVDYAVMEHTKRASVVVADLDWSDLGTWQALAEGLPKDRNGNIALGDTIAVDSRNSTLFAQSRRLAALGVEDLLIAETPDAVLVAAKERAGEVAEMARLAAAKTGRRTVEHHPWGSVRTLHAGGGFEVRHRTLAPGAEFREAQRGVAGHWLVAQGTGTVHCAGEAFACEAPQTFAAREGTDVRVSNTGTGALHMVEVRLVPTRDAAKQREGGSID